MLNIMVGGVTIASRNFVGKGGVWESVTLASRRGEGVKKGQKLRHIIFEWPLNP